MPIVEVDYASPRPPDDSLWQIARSRPGLIAILGTVAIFVLTFAAYASSMRGDFIWDDNHYVSENPLMTSPEGLQKIWTEAPVFTQYYPLTLTTFWIERHIFGLNPVGYHIVNVVLHASGACLLWLLLRRLGIRGAWAAAAVFALHPVQVESVAWITERKNVLCGVFYFATILTYLRYIKLTAAPERVTGTKREWLSLPEDPTRLYALIVFLFAGALLSKSVAATLPGAVLVIIWWKRGRLALEDFKPLLPLLGMSIVMGFVTSRLEYNTIGASGNAWDYAPTVMGEVGARCIIAGRAVWFYLQKLLVPAPLIFIYPRWDISAGAAWQYLFPISVIAALVALWILRGRIGRGPLACALYFVGTLFPALGFINIYPMQYSFVADHFQYLACVGIIVLVMASLARGVEALMKIDALNPAAAPAGVVVLLMSMVIGSALAGFKYNGLKVLWETTLTQTNHTSWMAANNYGLWVLRTQPANLDGAEAWFQKAIRLKADHVVAWYNLGLVADRRGDYKLAIARLQNALTYNRDYAPAQFKIPEMYKKLGDRKSAIAAYRYVVKLHPDSELGHLNLGTLLADEGDYEAAIPEYIEALRLNPNAVIAHFNLANALMKTGNYREAAEAYARVVQLEPASTKYLVSLGVALAAGGQSHSAEGVFKVALQRDRNFVDAYAALGRLYFQVGSYKESAEQFRKALALTPQSEEIQKNLAEAMDLEAHPEKRPATTRATTPATTRRAPATR